MNPFFSVCWIFCSSYLSNFNLERSFSHNQPIKMSKRLASELYPRPSEPIPLEFQRSSYKNSRARNLIFSYKISTLLRLSRLVLVHMQNERIHEHVQLHQGTPI